MFAVSNAKHSTYITVIRLGFYKFDGRKSGIKPWYLRVR